MTNPYPFTQLLIQSAGATWKDYVEHDFVKQLGQGTLDRSKFVHFIKRAAIRTIFVYFINGLFCYLQTGLSVLEVLRTSIRVSACMDN